jgi:hypothetical protein
MNRLMTLTVLAVGLATDVHAQQQSPVAWPVDSGTMVRVRSTSLGPSFRKGTLLATTADSIWIAVPRSDALGVPIQQITSMGVFRESHTNKATYTMVGLLVGALGGALLGAATYSPSKCDPSVTFCVDVFDRGASAAMGAVVLGAVGGLVGLMAGASPKESWTPVSLPSR